VPYKSRPINFGYLINPTMAGLETLARSGQLAKQRRDAQLQSLAQSIDLRRDRAQRQREFDLQYGLSERRQGLAEQEFAFRQAQVEEAKRDRQANETFMLDQIDQLGQQLGLEKQMMGAPQPETADRFNKFVAGFGSPDQVAVRLALREEPCKPGGT